MGNKHIITARWPWDSHVKLTIGKTRTTTQAWCWRLPHAPSDEVEQAEGPPSCTTCADLEGGEGVAPSPTSLAPVGVRVHHHTSFWGTQGIHVMIVDEMFDFSQEVSSTGEGGNAPNRRFWRGCGDGVHCMENHGVQRCALDLTVGSNCSTGNCTAPYDS